VVDSIKVSRLYFCAEISDNDNMETQTYTFDSNIVSDLYKDAYGSRPGEGFWCHWDESTSDEKQEIWDNLCSTLEREVERERELQRKAVADFEERIGFALRHGANNRVTAIRWICEAYKVQNEPGTMGWEHLEYELGLPYGYIEGKPHKYG
jgi:hypothetical protein